MRIETGKDTIANVSIRGLFDRFNHELDFNGNESLAIVTSPNGYGKTTVLRIIDSIFNCRFNFLWDTPFQEILVTLSSSREIKILKSTNDLFQMTADASSIPYR